MNRFNCLSAGETLDKFEWFEIAPVRDGGEAEGCNICPIEDAQFWTIYGRVNEGTGAEPEFLAYAVHDETNVRDIVRIARQISLETGKDFAVMDAARLFIPAQGDFTDIACYLTDMIHDDLPDFDSPEDFRDDDFDNHPYAELREAFCDYSAYHDAYGMDPFKEEVSQ